LKNPGRKNEKRQRLSSAAKERFLSRFAEDCARGHRGGVTEAEMAEVLKKAFREEAVREVQES
jgi:hypothetical protein